MKRIIIFLVLAILFIFAVAWIAIGIDNHERITKVVPKTGYNVVTKYKTPNINPGTNSVEGIVLHHTASLNISHVLQGFCTKGTQRSSHVVIAKDGTRYVLAPPTARTQHAGASLMNGREDCNRFTIGIEFDGNTCMQPLTNEQIHSAIEYIRPIMRKYHISVNDIVTHASIRTAWLKKHSKNTKDVKPKVDISDKEYNRFIDSLKICYQARLGEIENHCL